MIIWKGTKGFLAIVIVALVDFVFRQHLLDAYIDSVEPTLGKTLIASALFILPLAFLDFKDYRKDRVFTNASFFVPVCFFPLALVALGVVFWSAPYQ